MLPVVNHMTLQENSVLLNQKHSLFCSFKHRPDRYNNLYFLTVNLKRFNANYFSIIFLNDQTVYHAIWELMWTSSLMWTPTLPHHTSWNLGVIMRAYLQNIYFLGEVLQTPDDWSKIHIQFSYTKLIVITEAVHITFIS